MNSSELRTILATALSVALGVAGCGRGGGGASISFTKAAMTSLPAVTTPGTSGQGLRASSAVLGTGTIADYQALLYLFRLECQHVPNDNYCPPTVHPSSDLMDPTRFEMGSLIGMIYHAQMYTGSLVTGCSGEGTSMTVSPSSYAAANPGGNPTKFVLDEYYLYTCRSSNVSDANAETRVVSAVADGSYQAALHTRHNYNSGDGRLQTDFSQVYVSMEGSSPRFLALNFSAATPHASRIVLLVNLTSHRFALKYYVPTQPGNLSSWAPAFYAVATGVGGYDLATGTANPGYYSVSFLDYSPGPVPRQLCVNNVGGVIAASSDCTSNSVPMTWASSDAIRSYLGISAEDAARAAPFLAPFASEAQLTAADAWQTTGDEDLYWPATLH